MSEVFIKDNRHAGSELLRRGLDARGDATLSAHLVVMQFEADFAVIIAVSPFRQEHQHARRRCSRESEASVPPSHLPSPLGAVAVLREDEVALSEVLLEHRHHHVMGFVPTPPGARQVSLDRENVVHVDDAPIHTDAA